MDIISIITSEEQLNQVKDQALFNIKSYCQSFNSHISEVIEVEFDDEYWYLYQYNSIDDLEKVVHDILEDIKLYDCGDDDFFDYNPDNIGIVYQIFRIFKLQNRLDLVDKYKDKIINILKDYFEARQSGECDLDDNDDLYWDYLDSFINSIFPVTDDVI